VYFNSLTLSYFLFLEYDFRLDSANLEHLSFLGAHKRLLLLDLIRQRSRCYLFLRLKEGRILIQKRPFGLLEGAHQLGGHVVHVRTLPLRLGMYHLLCQLCRRRFGHRLEIGAKFRARACGRSMLSTVSIWWWTLCFMIDLRAQRRDGSFVDR